MRDTSIKVLMMMPYALPSHISLCKTLTVFDSKYEHQWYNSTIGSNSLLEPFATYFINIFIRRIYESIFGWIFNIKGNWKFQNFILEGFYGEMGVNSKKCSFEVVFYMIYCTKFQVSKHHFDDWEGLRGIIKKLFKSVLSAHSLKIPYNIWRDTRISS